MTRTIKNFKAVDFMRKSRDEISKKLIEMTDEEILKWLGKNRTDPKAAEPDEGYSKGK